MKPNVVVIGAAKAGTTSLYNYLIQHPEVFLPKERKEINYLGGVNQTVFSDEEYHDLYKGSDSYPVRMDISTSYLYADKAALKIEEFLGKDTKIVALVRNPVEASYSLWRQMRHYGGESLSFEEGLKAENKRRDNVTVRQDLMGWADNYFYTDRYKYVPQLQRYYDVFPAQNIKVFVFEEFFENLEKSWIELCGFLDIDSSTTHIDHLGTIHNPASSGHKSKILHKLIHTRMPIKKLVTWVLPESLKSFLRLRLDDLNKKRDKKETMSIEAQRNLRKTFEGDIKALENLLDRPLESVWFNQ